MAFKIMAKTLKFLFLSKLSKIVTPYFSMTNSQRPISKDCKAPYPHNHVGNLKNVLPYLHKNFLMKNSNVYENLINQSNKQTKFCTKPPKKEPEEIPPPGRHRYHKETEQSINEQISAEFDAAFSYLSMACFFGRTEIALPGCQGFFMSMYEEELEHAMVFVNYQLLRGAYVVLNDIEVPENQDFKSIKYAFSEALEMEKCVKEVLETFGFAVKVQKSVLLTKSLTLLPTYVSLTKKVSSKEDTNLVSEMYVGRSVSELKLESLFEVAEKHKDLEVMDIVSTQYMHEQNRSICELARLLKKADMTDNPVGEYLFDKMIFSSFVKKSDNNPMYKKKLDEESENKVYK